jgi:predicted O-methyltransferase YrrM
MTAGGSSMLEVQKLLRVLAARRLRAAEIGTAFGKGAAAIAAGLAPGGTLHTVELDPERARHARETLAFLGTVTVLEGDWRGALPPHAPFDFLFVDGGTAKTDPTVFEMAAPGALLVIDDLTPGFRGRDPVRELWLGSDALAAVEILTTPGTAAIVATRLS